jgi:hypothetical protein
MIDWNVILVKRPYCILQLSVIDVPADVDRN